MSNQLTIMTAQGFAADREREVLRSIEATRRSATPAAARSTLRIRIVTLVLRLRRRAVPAA